MIKMILTPLTRSEVWTRVDIISTDENYQRDNCIDLEIAESLSKKMKYENPILLTPEEAEVIIEEIQEGPLDMYRDPTGWEDYGFASKSSYNYFMDRLEQLVKSLKCQMDAQNVNRKNI